MKSFVVYLLVMLLFAPATMLAQDHDRRSVDRGLQMLAQAQRIQSELELTGEQLSEIEGVFEEVRAENAALREQLDESDAYQEWRAEQRRKQIAERRERGEARREQGEQMRERLEEMSPEEREEMRERMEERRSEMYQHRGDRSARGQRAMRNAPEEVRELMQEMRANMAEAMQQAREVLTAEQQERLQELVRETRRGGERGQRFRQHRGQ